MSFDLLFWRGETSDSPADVIKKLSRRQSVPGIEPLEAAAITDAFREAFNGEIEIEAGEDGGVTAIHGPLFSVQLSDPVQCVWVTCSWKVTEQPEVFDRLLRAGYELLGCNAYNPQVNEFAANRREGA